MKSEQQTLHLILDHNKTQHSPGWWSTRNKFMIGQNYLFLNFNLFQKNRAVKLAPSLTY
nr:MAG TPA: hypothetical protein [Caudoviricetes sp.]